MKLNISIIIVSFGTPEFLFLCLESIKLFKILNFEIIVVDNNEAGDLRKQLKKRFPEIKYVKSKTNLGFGGGNNLGASIAKGKYLFFLNPDTKLLNNSIEILYNFLEKNKKAGIVSPLLVDKNLKSFKTQSRRELTLISSIFSFSFLRKFFPYKSIYNDPFFKNWDEKSSIEVETIPGAALMISKQLFNKVGGFDDRFFLYFEENDISKRVRDLGLKLFVDPKSKIMHEVGISTAQFTKRDEEFNKSRFLYFNKHFGLARALLIEIFLKINSYFLIILLFFIAALFLRTYNLQNSMSFIGDQGWFYLSARDLVLGNNFPLVGITSSHTWLHQGPLWTYMLSFALFIGKFNPVSGAYLTAIIGALSVLLIYKVTSELFSARAGVIAAMLYAVSPMIIDFERTPFDTAPIPFFTMLYLFFLYKWLNGSRKYFPLILFTLALLYNLELSTFVLFFPFALIFLYGLIKKKGFVTILKDRKILLYSAFALAVPMLPIIAYDINNGFKQTVVFLGWTLYKPFASLLNHSPSGSVSETISFLFNAIKEILMPNSFYISALLFVSGLFLLIYKSTVSRLSITKPHVILLILLFFSFVGIILNKTPSGAYLPILFPFVIISASFVFSELISVKQVRYAVIIILLVIVLLNVNSSLKQANQENYKKRIVATDKIIALSNNGRYNLIGTGPGSQFRSFTMNYEYLLWWKGHPLSANNEKLKMYIKENGEQIEVYKIK